MTVSNIKYYITLDIKLQTTKQMSHKFNKNNSIDSFKNDYLKKGRKLDISLDISCNISFIGVRRY